MDRVLRAVGIRRELPLELQTREALSIDEIRQRFYPHVADGSLFKEIWDEIADAFEVPAERLRPDDRFGRELQPRSVFGVQDASAMLEMSFDRRRRSMGLTRPTPACIDRVDDYIRFFLPSDEPDR